MSTNAAKPRRPSLEEREERTNECRRLLGSGLYDGEIKRIVAEKYGCSPRTIERYLRRARQAMRDAAGQPAEEMRSEAAETYRAVLADPNTTAGERIKARERLDKLFGLEIRRVESPGANLSIPVSAEELQTMTDEDLDRLHNNIGRVVNGKGQ